MECTGEKRGAVGNNALINKNETYPKEHSFEPKTLILVKAHGLAVLETYCLFDKLNLRQF